MENSLVGASVLLIGGGGGIGSALVEQLYKEKVKSIVVAGRQSREAVEEATGLRHEYVDVTDLASVQGLAQRLSPLSISIVINCAGVNGNRRLFSDNDISFARREMEVNYFGLMNVATVFGPQLAAKGSGIFVALLSFLSHVNHPQMATYCASKAAAHSLTQALRAELIRSGVRVCGIYPTAVDTEMSRHIPSPKLSPVELAGEVVAFLMGAEDDLYPGDAAAAHSYFLRDPKGLAQAMTAEIN